MNRIITLLFIVVIAMYGCKENNNTDKKNTSNYIILKGKVKNATSKNLIIGNTTSGLPLKVPLNKKGEFNDTLSLKTEGYLFTDGKNRFTLPISPNTNLTLNYDANKPLSSLKVTGEGADEFIYMAKRDSIVNTNAIQIFTTDEKTSTKLQNKVLNELKALLKAQKKLSKWFVNIEKKQIESIALYHKYMYSIRYKNLSDNYNNELKKMIDLDNDVCFTYSPYYFFFLLNYWNNTQNDAIKQGEDRDLVAFKVARELKNKRIANKLLFLEFEGNLPRVKDAKKYYDMFMKTSTNKEHKEVATKKYRKLTAYAPGKISPQFHNYQNYKGGSNSLSDFKGKYVLIDIWATWCAPCVKEIPYLIKLEEEYKNKNIEFVSISVDGKATANKWGAFVKKKGGTGIHLRADNELNSQFMKDYLVVTIPRFILINPEGKIINGDAPRPSNPRLKKLLNKYLK